MSQEDSSTLFRRLADTRPASAEARQASPEAPTSEGMLTPVLRPGERLPYIPFGTKTRPTRLYVRGRVSCHQIPYGYMPIVTHPPWNPNRLIITVNQLVIVVRGNAIAPIADAIGLQACDFIQEYDPEYFLEPIDPHAPLVTGIQSKLRHGLAEDEDAGDELAGPARLRAGGG